MPVLGILFIYLTVVVSVLGGKGEKNSLYAKYFFFSCFCAYFGALIRKQKPEQETSFGRHRKAK